MERKITINEVKEIAKKDNSGFYYVVKALLDDVAIEALCFDAKIKPMIGEQTLDITEKNGKHFINFPREGKTGGGKPWGKSPAEINLQTNSFAMSYGKDLVVAFIAKGIYTDTEAKDALFEFYHAIRKELEVGNLININDAQIKPKKVGKSDFTDEDRAKNALSSIEKIFKFYWERNKCLANPEIRKILAERIFHTGKQADVKAMSYMLLEQGERRFRKILTDPLNTPDNILAGKINEPETLADIPDEAA